MKKVSKLYNKLLSKLNLFLKNTSNLVLTFWNILISNLKTSILILFIVIVNKPLIVFLINMIISILIRNMFFNVIYAETIYNQMNDVEVEPGEPVFFDDLFKWFIDTLVWFIHWDPPRPPRSTILIPQSSYPDRTFIEEIDNIVSKQEVQVETKDFISQKDPLTILYECQILAPIKKPIIDVVLNTKSKDEQTKISLVKSYESWVESTKISQPFFNSSLLRNLHFKLETCKNESDLFNTSIQFVKESFPIYKRPMTLSDYENSASNFNLYLTDLQNRMLSQAELISFFHFKAGALAYNKAYLYNEQEDLLHLKNYYDAEISKIRSYVSKFIKNNFKK